MNRVDALWPFGRYLIGWPGALTARVRAGFDPQGVLNAGRMWAGV